MTSLLEKFPYISQIRYDPAATYFARIRTQGKLIVRSHEMDSRAVAQLRLADLKNMNVSGKTSRYRGCRENDPEK
jgi:hypothetical protein